MNSEKHNTTLTLFLCGDVMPGRGIDQILPFPCDPVLYEPFMKSAKDYVDLAVKANGPVPVPASPEYIWGAALDKWSKRKPDARIVNLETSITRSPHYWKNKGINYRMSPENAACLRAAGIDCCALGNNHVLDWGYQGLNDTLQVLNDLSIRHAGAGCNLNEAITPARIPVRGGHIAVFSMGAENSGVPVEWSALADRPGIWVTIDLSLISAGDVCSVLAQSRNQDDRIVFSIHWGGNWGYEIPADQKRFAHLLIDEGLVDVVFGHSSHHPKGIEVYKSKLILYGCGDFLNDYEGIGGYEAFRGDLCLMYFVMLEPKTGCLSALEMVPLQIRQLKLSHASESDISWLHDVMDRECRRLGTRIHRATGNSFRLEW